VLKKLWDNNLVYKDYRVSPYCPRCGTPLSNFEVNQGYKETKDPGITVKFEIKESELKGAYFLVWTTTPWTLPGNVALSINPEVKYLLVEQNGSYYILAKARIGVLQGEYKIVREVNSKELIGLKYIPPFDYLLKANIENIENAFRVVPASFVSIEEGTGIVHIAPMYGEEDFKVGKKFNLPFYHTVDEFGNFKESVSDFKGQFVKSADVLIIDNLEKRLLLYKKEEILHSYPFCWRCDTPLIYYAIDSWFIAVTKFKKQLIANSKKINWVPSYIKEGRFGNWLKEAKDWAFSRNRFWGAPLPIWECVSCNNKKCIGSIKELKAKIKDLHRPYIDGIELKCDKCGSTMKRVPQVFDCWFESGSMPYAQWHYPFENKKLVETTFPADFIAEGLDQTRGWFYTLHVIATALTLKNIGLGKNKPAFKNAIVNGLILDSQGRKLSKKLRNYPEPKEVFDKYGADALRYFLLSSTNMGEDYRFSDKGVEEVWRKIILTIFNSYNFLQNYTSSNKKLKSFKFLKSPKLHILDKWILSRLNRLNKEIIVFMDKYEITKASRLLAIFVEDLSNWYIRRSRKRDISEQLRYTLMQFVKISAPFLPFLSENIYQKLRTKKDPISVHLCDYPKAQRKFINSKIEKNMAIIRELSSQALALRVSAGIKVRQPLSWLKIPFDKGKISNDFLEVLKDEINVKKIIFGKSLELNTEITPELKEEGFVREIIRNIQETRKQLKLLPVDLVTIIFKTEDLYLKDVLIKNSDFIKKETFSKDIILNGVLDKDAKKIKLDDKELQFVIKNG
jgi:isoleucyl-tRNA synthetase